jgi:hypothetical protein
VLIKVPSKCLITIHSKAVQKYQFPRDCSVHGRLAAFLTLENAAADKEHRAWQETWPSEEEFDEIMPFRWRTKLQEYLMPPARGERKFCRDSDLEIPNIPVPGYGVLTPA